jgi:hypothetical protein
MYVRRLTRRTYNLSFAPFACLCEHADRRLCGSKKGNKSTHSTMSLRSRFSGALRIEQNSPMDTVLKKSIREPLPPARRAYAPPMRKADLL